MVTTIRSAASTGRLRRLLAPLATATGAVGAVGYVRTTDPNEPGHYPSCPFLAVTGYFCPGCGTLRAVHALSNGHPAEAVDFNVYTVALIPLMTYFWVRWFTAAWNGRPRRSSVADARWIWLLLGFILTFWVVRNLQFGAALAP